MAYHDITLRYGESPKSPNTVTVEQLLREGEASRWSPISSPRLDREHELEDDHLHHHKKSVLARVKQKAKKWRQTLSKKKHHDGNNITPPWGVSLEEDEVEDGEPEYLGAPMYESELAPEGYKETARQSPRPQPMVNEKHVMTGGIKHNIQQETEKPPNPNKTVTTTVTEKLTPAYAAVSDATNAIASKIQSLTVSAPVLSETDKYGAHASDHTWDKGVSVKEYIMQKLEPGEDERALSQVISEAMSPKKSPREVSVVEKVKEAVSLLLWSDEPSKSTATPSTTFSSSHIPLSTTAHEVVEEENRGRILQPN